MIRFGRIFGQYLGLKLVSLLMAYLVWAWVVGRAPLVRFEQIPVDLQAPAGVVVLEFSPATVTVRLQGDPGVVRRINSADVVARLRVPRVDGRAMRTLTIEPENVDGLPSGVDVQVRDPQVKAVLESAMVKTVRVSPRTSGKVPFGYRVAQLQADPGVVTVRGPASAVRPLQTVTTDEIELAGHSLPFTARATLARSDPHMTFEPETVRVSIDIQPLPGTADQE
ncbi:MAG: YbbR-like domain-containing protein [Acidobacteria bacterium]|nr:YbbR-like domain-containing protein [Acidobacteriota bacterium]